MHGCAAWKWHSAGYCVYIFWLTCTSCAVCRLHTMVSVSQFVRALLVFLVINFTAAVPINLILPLTASTLERGSTAPCFSSTEPKDCHIYKKSEVMGIHRNASPSPQDRFSSTIIASGSLVSDEDRQIQRVMDVKEDETTAGSERPWLNPDVQVVLWFVVLCCLTQGIVTGLRW